MFEYIYFMEIAPQLSTPTIEEHPSTKRKRQVIGLEKNIVNQQEV